MNKRRLIVQTITYYRKSYLSVFIAIVITVAVLTGALIVGDSVRYSLTRLTDIRLGNTRWSMHAGERFFRAALGKEMAIRSHTLVVPVLQVDGVGIQPENQKRIGNLQVTGIDSAFLQLWEHPVGFPVGDEAIISRNVAEKLEVSPGDQILIRLPARGKAPQGAPFIVEESPTISFRVVITAIAEEDEMGRFSLQSNQNAPFNLFLPIDKLSSLLEIPGMANMLLVANSSDKTASPESWNKLLGNIWEPEDAGLNFDWLNDSATCQITSDRIFIDDQTIRAIHGLLPGATTMLTWLVNRFEKNGKSTPYSFVTAVPDSFFSVTLSGRDILINEWLADDLQVKPGDTLGLSWFVVAPFRLLKEQNAPFVVKGIIPVEYPGAGPELMPDFPGMHDAGHCREWETGAPIDLKSIREKDEQYWNRYRGTPKGFISFDSGLTLWDNPFGSVTAVRFLPGNRSLEKIKRELMNHLQPEALGMVFIPVWKQGKTAASHSTDFGGLFLSLSFFLIAAGLLLTGMIFSLHLRQRLAETGILSAIGFEKGLIIRMFFREIMVVVIAGALLGSLGGILYNQLILMGLNTIWQEAVRTDQLTMHVNVSSLALGIGIGILTGTGTLLVILFRALRKPNHVLISQASVQEISAYGHLSRFYSSVSWIILLVSFLLPGYLLASGHTENTNWFLLAAGLNLIGFLGVLRWLLIRISRFPGKKTPGFMGLIIKNLALRRTRTIGAITLLALGSFIIIITGANRKTFYGVESDRKSGAGGFCFWAETSLPILYDLNTSNGRTYFGLDDEPLLDGLRFFQMHRLAGNDASCLNLNQVHQPMILGVPSNYFDSIGAFRFITLEKSVDPEHPWRVLREPADSAVILAFTDQTVLTWGMMKSAGDTLRYTDEAGNDLLIRLAGGMDNSVFQGYILVSDHLFQKYYPSVSGSRVMLIDGNPENPDQTAIRLETLFADYGMEVETVSQRLASFYSIENTYLTVFMMLGVLGILIGTIGLGVVIWRNILDRKPEIALYQTIGFGKSTILRLIMAEYLFILITGILLGCVAVITGILPSLLSPAFRVPVWFISMILVLVMINGIFWIYFPVASSLRANLIQTLRKE